MTTNIPPEIADNVPAPAPVRISPEVRKTILTALRVAVREAEIEEWSGDIAIAFVEALP